MANGSDPYLYYGSNNPNDYTYFGSGSTWSSSLVTTVTGSGTIGPWPISISPTLPTSISRSEVQEFINNVVDELTLVHQRYGILDPTFQNCDVLASKMLFSKAPKGLCEFGVSAPVNGKRNVFLFVKVYDAGVIDTCIVDVFAGQHGGMTIQPVIENLPPLWSAEFRYKNPASLVKRLTKEGRPLKELSLKDAIALSTRYDVSSISPTQMDLHRINPSDPDGQKFLEKFSKEVGFKTTLAQLLLDSDPIVAEKAQVIAQIILKR